MVSRQLKSLSRTAPIALQWRDLLNDVLTGDNLQQGLALELERLDDIFASSDALEGLSALPRDVDQITLIANFLQRRIARPGRCLYGRHPTN